MVRLMSLTSERGSVVGVYDMSVPSNPILKQLLPSGLSPEGAIALPTSNLFATANEVDLREKPSSGQSARSVKQGIQTWRGPKVIIFLVFLSN